MVAEGVALAACELVDLGQLLPGSGQADLKAVDLAEPSFSACLVDAGEEVIADLLEAAAAGGVRAKEPAAQA